MRNWYFTTKRFVKVSSICIIKRAYYMTCVTSRYRNRARTNEFPLDFFVQRKERKRTKNFGSPRNHARLFNNVIFSFERNQLSTISVAHFSYVCHLFSRTVAQHQIRFSAWRTFARESRDRWDSMRYEESRVAHAKWTPRARNDRVSLREYNFPRRNFSERREIRQVRRAAVNDSDTSLLDIFLLARLVVLAIKVLEKIEFIRIYISRYL